MSTAWDQSKFDATLREYLVAHESDVWPRCVNETAFMVADAALSETPAVEIGTVVSELLKPITPKGSTKSIPVGFAMAAKRASAGWAEGGRSRVGQTAKRKLSEGGKANLTRGWRKEMDYALDRILGSRARALAFMRLGWLFVKLDLVKFTRLSMHSKSPGAIAKAHGRLKGGAEPATPGHLVAVIKNSAHAQSEKRGAFLTIGYDALRRAMEKRTASMREYLEKQMAPGVDKFNSKQH